MKVKKVLIVLVVCALPLAFLVSCGPTGALGHCFQQHVLAKMDEHAEHLKLNEAQKEKYLEFRKRISENMTKRSEERSKHFSDMERELNSDNPNVPMLVDKVKEGMEQRRTAVSENLALFQDFYNTLNKDQQKEVIEHFREKMHKVKTVISLLNELAPCKAK
jgi:hypothetical protein